MAILAKALYVLSALFSIGALVLAAASLLGYAFVVTMNSTIAAVLVAASFGWSAVLVDPLLGRKGPE